MMMVMICRMMVVKMFGGVIMVTGWDDDDENVGGCDNVDGDSPTSCNFLFSPGSLGSEASH